MSNVFLIRLRMQQWTFAGGHEAHAKTLAVEPRPVYPHERMASQGLVSFPRLAEPPHSVSIMLSETDIQTRRYLALDGPQIIVKLPPSGEAVSPVPAKTAQRLTVKWQSVVYETYAETQANFSENPRKAPVPPGTHKSRLEPLVSDPFTRGMSSKGKGKARTSPHLTPSPLHPLFLKPKVYVPPPAPAKPKSKPKLNRKAKGTSPTSKLPPTAPSLSTLPLPRFLPRRTRALPTTHLHKTEVITPLYKRLSGPLTLEEAIRAHIHANETRYRVLKVIAGYMRPAQSRSQPHPQSRHATRRGASQERKRSVCLSPVAPVAETKQMGEWMEIRGWSGRSEFEREVRRRLISVFKSLFGEKVEEGGA